MLNPLGADLIELFSGSYEAPAMHGQARETCFLEFAQDIATALAIAPHRPRTWRWCRSNGYHTQRSYRRWMHRQTAAVQ